ncbi:MAG: hypothetical protein IJV40_16115 [Oscillospiraceae bacterium]|nr:hypothetical protein [Oscillospiraceae bacterium]
MKKLIALILVWMLVCSSGYACADNSAMEALTDAHGCLVSTSTEPVTDEEISAVLRACETVTLGTEKTLHLNIITDLDLLQELLPTYTASGLVNQGCAAIIVSVSSDKGTSDQYHQEDLSSVVAGGMMAQQICVAAQLQGLGFRVITDSIYESGYSLYQNNEPAPENAVHIATDWEEWLRMFAIPTEKYYRVDPVREPVKLMNGNHVQLKSGEYAYFEADDSPALKQRVEFFTGYMTPVAIVLLAHSDDAPDVRHLTASALETFWDGSYDPYPQSYGGSGTSK